jgi:hypothetical protein
MCETMPMIAIVYDSPEDERWANLELNPLESGAVQDVVAFRDLYPPLGPPLQKLAKYKMIVFLLSEQAKYTLPASDEDLRRLANAIQRTGALIAVAGLKDHPTPKFFELFQTIYQCRREGNVIVVSPDLVYALSLSSAAEVRDAALSAADEFGIAFDPGLTAEQMCGTLSALANYFRACGGIGLPADIGTEQAAVLESINA